MIPFSLALGLALIAILLVYALLRGSLSQPRNLAELVESLRPVNVSSLLHLSCTADDELLKRNLSRRDYRKLKRQRNRVILQYYRAALRNCSLLRGYGEMLQAETDERLSSFGKELCSASLDLRLALFRASCSVFFCLLFPTLDVDLSNVSEQYQNAGRRLKTFATLNSPKLSAKITTAFSIS